MKTPLLFFLCLFATGCLLAQEKEPRNPLLHFDMSGRLTGEPPMEIRECDRISVIVHQSQTDFAARVVAYTKHYLELLESLYLSDEFLGSEDGRNLRAECLQNLRVVKADYVSFLDPVTKYTVEQALKQTAAGTASNRFPSINELLREPVSAVVSQFDANGKLLNKTTLTLKAVSSADQSISSFESCESIKIEKDFSKLVVDIRRSSPEWNYIVKHLSFTNLPAFDTVQKVKIKSVVDALEIKYRGPSTTQEETLVASIERRTMPTFQELEATYSAEYDSVTFMKHFTAEFEESASFFSWGDFFSKSDKYKFKDIQQGLIKQSVDSFKTAFSIFRNGRDINTKELEDFFASDKGKPFTPYKDLLTTATRKNDFDALFTKAIVQYGLKKNGIIEEYDAKLKEEINAALKVIDPQLTTLQEVNQFPQGLALRTAVIQQLWIIGDDWENLNILQKSVPPADSGEDKDEDEDKNKSEEGLKNALAAVEAQIAYLKEIGKIEITTTGDTLPFPDHNLKLLAKLYERKGELEADLKKLTKPATTQSPASPSISLIPETSDELLNKVILTNRPMHHIDYTAESYMNRTPIREIGENTSLDIFVHNDPTATNYSASFSYTNIDKNETVIAEELSFSGNQGDGRADNIEQFLRKYLLVRIYREVLRANFDKSISPAIPMDETPKCQSKRVQLKETYSPDTRAPYNVRYTIVDAQNDKDTLLKGGYRVNKLYRFRYKIGPSYSWLTQRDYTVNENGTYTMTEKSAGLQTIFGLQIYPCRNDIRKKDWARQSFVFTGFNIGSGTLENFYFGYGYELIDGMAITVGLHTGITDKLYSSNGELKVNERAWASPKCFVSLTFDHTIFEAIFKNSVRTNATEILKQP